MDRISFDEIGEEVGVVLSRASASYAPVLLRRDMELRVREEDLAVIVDDYLEGYYPFGVIRWVTRHEPFLKQGIHNVYVENPDALTRDTVLPFSNAYVEIYGAFCFNEELCSGAPVFTANTYAPHPSSKVYRLSSAEPLAELLRVEKPFSIGRHKYSGWRLPLDATWTVYHVGVFGATGTGKSRLVSGLVSRLAEKGFSLIVFDHTGVDYALAAKQSGIRVVDASSIKIPLLVFSEALSTIMGVRQSSYSEIVDVAVVCHDRLVKGEAQSVYDCLSLEPQPGRKSSLTRFQRNANRPTWSKEEFKKTLISVASSLNTRKSTILKLAFMLENMVPSYIFDKMAGRTLDPEDVVREALEEKILVIDMSGEQSIEVKRSIVASIAQAGWRILFEEKREKLNLGLVVDEAQNYACEYCGPSGRELETIAREGRKWGYFLIVASQRVTRDIRPGIRSNLGTVFFSKLQATNDLQELSGYLDLGRVSEASLAMLGRREFFVAGLMNPLRRPLLLSVDEIKGLER